LEPISKITYLPDLLVCRPELAGVVLRALRTVDGGRRS
jgi:hypothetical protein